MTSKDCSVVICNGIIKLHLLVAKNVSECKLKGLLWRHTNPLEIVRSSHGLSLTSQIINVSSLRTILLSSSIWPNPKSITDCGMSTVSIVVLL